MLIGLSACIFLAIMVLNKLTLVSLSPFTNPAIVVLFFLLIPSACPLQFSFTSFDTSSCKKIKLQGNATLSSYQQAIELTRKPSGNSLYGRAIYYRPLNLWSKGSDNVSDFNTAFSFIINSNRSKLYADGMAFFLSATNLPLPVEVAGSAFGIRSRKQALSNDDKAPYVAVEFDTYKNEWDPDTTHVGININNMNSSTTADWPGDIEHGRRNEASISYRFATKILNVIYTGFKNNRTIYQNLSYQVDLREHLPEWVDIGISAATGNLFETHTLLSWNFSSFATVSPWPKREEKDKKTAKSSLVAGLTAGGSVLLVISLCLLWFFFVRKWLRGEKGEDVVFDQAMKDRLESSTGPKKFLYRELARATKNFSEKLGEGGFGVVFRGYLKESNMHIAVKRISRDSKQGLKEYVSEVLIISRIRHRNLVQLVGWCHENNGFLLVYEYMSNGSLASHLFREENSLSWEKRYKIALGLASGLLYLHEEWEECVVHRDIKPSNVLLDTDFNAKLGDFGLARLVDHEKGSRTTILAGTMGYLAPEYATTGKASKDSDVFSFGIVVLEIACGRKPIVPMAEEGQIVMLKWIWELYEAGKVLEAADKRLGGEFDEKQMECLLIVGIWCAHPDYNLRPTMRQAIQVLKSEALLPVLSLTTPVATSVFDLLDPKTTQHYPIATRLFLQP